MATGIFARGMSTKTALLIMRSSDAPSRILHAIRNGAAGCSRILLAQLLPPANRMEGCHWHSPWQTAERRTLPPGFDRQREQEHRSAEWAEILRSVFLIGSTTATELPGLMRQLEVDRIVLPTPATAEYVWPILSDDGSGISSPPLWVMNPNIAVEFRNAHFIRRILFPLSLDPGFEGRLHLACRMARSNGATLSILHVFRESCAIPAPERSPVYVHSRLPLRSLRLSGLLCPMEVCIRSGDPAETILQFQEKGAHDLIFMRGPRCFSGSQVPIGGVSHRIMAEARCPVILVRDCPRASDQPGPVETDREVENRRQMEWRPHVEMVN